MDNASEVVVVGGGISGTAAAYELARAGVSVTLVERGDLASMASGWTLAGVRQSGRHPSELPLAQAAKIARVWGGLIDVTPDALPVIERAPEVEGLIVAAGFSGHGFCLGPITGQLICELITKGTPSLPLHAFRRARFAGSVGATRARLHG